MRKLFLSMVVVLLGVAAGFVLPAAGLVLRAPQEPKPRALPISRGKKLFLKDGSFQMVRDWEVRPDPSGQGHDRVRYYSVERSKYEELPAELVDFEATKKYEQDLAEHQAELREDIEARRVEQLAAEIDVDASIEIAPGLFLPDDVGMWVLEPEQGGGGNNILLPLTQVNAAAKVDKGRLLAQIFVPIPVVPGKHKVEIQGKRAVLRISHHNPEFYIRTEDKREPEMELIRVKVKGDKREVEVIKTYITGEKMEERNTVSVERWPVARGVYRLTLSQPLTPGEYVLAEILPGEGINLYVWDFGIDP